MRSPTSVGTAISQSSLIMTAAGWCGPHPGTTWQPCKRFSTCLDRSGALRSPMCPLTEPISFPRWWPRTVRARCAAPTRSMSCGGPPKPWTWCDARPGTTPGGWPGRPRNAVPGRPPADARPRPATERARGITGARYALWKNPENLTEKQRAKLEWIARTDPRLYRAYQLKEGLRLIFQMPIDQAEEALDRWVSCARRCRIPSFVKLQKDDRRAHPVDPGRDRAWTVQRPHRIGQHQDPAHHPHRIRIQVPRSPHRPGHAQPRRTPARATESTMTHGNSRRAKNLHYHSDWGRCRRAVVDRGRHLVSGISKSGRRGNKRCRHLHHDNAHPPAALGREEQHPSPRHTGRSPLLCARPNGRRQRYLVHARRRAGIRSPRSDPARLRSCAGLPFLTGPHRCEWSNDQPLGAPPAETIHRCELPN